MREREVVPVIPPWGRIGGGWAMRWRCVRGRIGQERRMGSLLRVEISKEI